ncbi:flavonol synthase/flavanone 3-hydroxylase-like [Iris pallida]|uniref:Flavonol synthase/flavanone 3-hydroxylase-like n=1 Tax=Iris pallida TaxID=29817 RepID=A0AAX6FBH5_IRIPA|nr:flavonol synthase/flavanone 3-hydroxylase-like [Iris pallida]
MVLGFDETFVLDIDHRPNPTVSESGSIPLVDLSPLLAGAGGDQRGSPAPPWLVEQVEGACRDWGFFQVVNHGVPTGPLERVRSAAEEFFALAAEEKRRVRRDEENPLGYNDKEYTKNVRDWKEMFDFTADERMLIPASAEPGEKRLVEIKNRWPEYPPELREACKEYTKAVEGLAYKLLELISLTLNLPAKRLNGYFEESTSIIRLLHYPPCPSPHLAMGVGRHKDSGGLTVLTQDEVGGLEVKRKSDGEWVRIKPIPNSYIVNIGAIIQVWSNDKYESVEHRVAVNSEKERFSVPFFLNPAHDTMVRPLEELVSEEAPAKYHEYNWGMFLKARKTSNFKNLGVENLQISHFRKEGC